MPTGANIEMLVDEGERLTINGERLTVNGMGYEQ